MTDEEIIGLYRNGQDERAFKEIVAAYSERLYWHVRRFVCSHEDTDDLLQEIFIKIGQPFLRTEETPGCSHGSTG